MTNLKYSGFKVGQEIRAYDFKPMEGRPDSFAQGEIISIPQDRGYACYEIKIKPGTGSSKCYYHGQSVFVPMELSFMEYDGRVTLVN